MSGVKKLSCRAQDIGESAKIYDAVRENGGEPGLSAVVTIRLGRPSARLESGLPTHERAIDNCAQSHLIDASRAGPLCVSHVNRQLSPRVRGNVGGKYSEIL